MVSTFYTSRVHLSPPGPVSLLYKKKSKSSCIFELLTSFFYSYFYWEAGLAADWSDAFGFQRIPFPPRLWGYLIGRLVWPWTGVTCLGFNVFPFPHGSGGILVGGRFGCQRSVWLDFRQTPSPSSHFGFGRQAGLADGGVSGWISDCSLCLPVSSYIVVYIHLTSTIY